MEVFIVFYINELMLDVYIMLYGLGLVLVGVKEVE